MPARILSLSRRGANLSPDGAANRTRNGIVSPELLAGIRAFEAMMQTIEALPEQLRPGFERGQDDSTTHDLAGAANVLHAAITCPPLPGFTLALADYLVCSRYGTFDEYSSEQSIVTYLEEFEPEGGLQCLVDHGLRAKRLDHPEWRLIFNAVCEIERLGRLLIDMDTDAEEYPPIHKAAMVRLVDLSHLICEVADGNDEPAEALERLHGLAR
jgi:hypothetical protein